MTWRGCSQKALDRLTHWRPDMVASSWDGMWRWKKLLAEGDRRGVVHFKG